MSAIDKRLLLINASDNVLICCQSIKAGTELVIEDSICTVTTDLGLGHKISRYDIGSGQKIMRGGVPIGSATDAIVFAEHVHTHNMKSDYIATHYRDAVKGST